jgi:ATP-GRASP peptide maturase of grasp-with-spasm system
MRKKVVIFSIHFDSTTDHVIDWLSVLFVDFVRINSEDFIAGNHSFELNLNSKESYNIWFRKGEKWNDNMVLSINEEVDKSIVAHIRKELYESWELYRVIHENTSRKKVGMASTKHIHKLTQLDIARNCGFVVPHSILTNTKVSLQKFKLNHYKIITKCIKDSTFLHINEKSWGQYTSIVTDEHIENMEETFFPSYFQEYIEKEIEIRVFYFNHEMYSMAIFSQLDSQTLVDFRQYNISKGNRTVPFNLPNDIVCKIHELMFSLNLNTGSLDIIKSRKGEYIFLEVNPSGQFGMVSKPCNYYLEKKVAKFLSE